MIIECRDNLTLFFIIELAQALSAINRINSFLSRETRGVQECVDVANNVAPVETVPPLTLRSASFMIGSQSGASLEGMGTECGEKDSSSFTVSLFDFSVGKGEVVAVCGPVGSGKSSLINGIIDEIPAASSSTKVEKVGSIAYVPQTPFILNATLRENILFGLPFDRDVYDRVLDACCLRQDLEQLGESKDLTEIGERGVTLSGGTSRCRCKVIRHHKKLTLYLPAAGQKQRVSLARAAYSRPDLVLLDDPLSALDAGTAKQVFSRLIKSPNSYYKNTAVLLVTHASHFLNRVDSLMVIVDGTKTFHGTWNELADYKALDTKTQSAIEFIRNSVQEGDSSDDENETSDESNENPRSESDSLKLKALMTVEEREHGLSSMHTWLLWFKKAGGFFYIGILVLLMTGDRFAYVGTEYWLARWTSGAYEPVDVFGTTFPPQSDGRSAQYQYLTVYAIILLISAIFTVFR